MVPDEVCDSHEPPRSTSYGREIDLTTAGRPKLRVCNGFDCTEVAYSLHSSIRRLHEHHLIPANVSDGHEPPRSTSHRREFDLTRVLDAPM